MRSRFTLQIIAVLVAFSPGAWAADKQQLAAQVFDAIALPQVEPMVDRLLQGFARERDPPKEVLQIYKETLLEVFRHPQYRQAYIAAYQQLFSEQELIGVVEMSKHPAFLAFARESGNLTQMTYPTFVKLNNEMKKKLEDRLIEKGLSEWK